eukprot:gene21898-8528_t
MASVHLLKQRVLAPMGANKQKAFRKVLYQRWYSWCIQRLREQGDRPGPVGERVCLGTSLVEDVETLPYIIRS